MFVYAALLATATTLPAAAERLYVPMVGAPGNDGRALSTEIWVANGAPSKAAVNAAFLRGGRGAEKRFDVEPGGRMLDLAEPGAVGLVAIDAQWEAVSAWIPDRWGTSVTEVPVLAERDLYQPGAIPGLQIARGYEKLMVGAANLSDEASSCEATLYDGDREVGRMSFDVPAKSLVRQDTAEALGAERATYAQVGCNRTFYPVGVTSNAGDGGTGVAIAKSTGPNGACNLFLTLTKQPDGSYYAESITAPNNVHTATKAAPKWIVCIKAPQQLNVTKAVFEWDVTAGPWYAKKTSGIHNLGYVFGERYRSGVVGNVNALGPSKSIVKFMQNYNMPRGGNTNNKASYLLVKGQVYHPVYTFDANNTTADLKLKDSGGAVLASCSKDTHPGNGHTLVVQPYGSGGLAGLALVFEFGNYTSTHPGHPEVPTIDWVYANPRIHLFVKP
jgi:hypothetical protein